MLFILGSSHNPFYNLAIEEFLLKNRDEEFVFFYRNKPSVIIGKHQNAYAESNYIFLKKNNIELARRLSGGGTVYHDSGNINFSFITNGQPGNLVDFKRFIEPVNQCLNSLGVASYIGDRNNLMIGEKKISGNAGHVFKNRALHHGTLLYSVNLFNLSNALKINPLNYTDRSVKSVRSRITNISENISEKSNIESFTKSLFTLLKNHFPNSDLYNISLNDEVIINKLLIEKYKTWEWNYGYSPKYVFRKTISGKDRVFEIELIVQKGIIEKMKIFMNSDECFSEISNIIAQTKHKEDEILKNFQNIRNSGFWDIIGMEEFVEKLF